MSRLFMPLVLIVGIVVALSVSSPVSSEPQVGKTNVQALMHDKLDHMQQLLDGLVTDDFERIAKQAELLRIVGKAASWQAGDSEQYTTHSRRYAHLTKNLQAAAKDGNRDAALLQYLQLNISCVDCHQYIREQKWESDPLPVTD